jgi:hypothetical protein
MLEYPEAWMLPSHHPIAAEKSRRLSIMEEECVLRDCMVAVFAQRICGLRYRPSEPLELAPVPDNFGLVSMSSASGSFYNTPSSSSLTTPNVRRESLADSNVHAKLLDTGDIDVFLKQMQRKHHDAYRRRNEFVKVHYHRSKVSVVQDLMVRKLREEEENRNDIEIVEQLMMRQLLDLFHAHRYSRLMDVQLEETLRRTQVIVLEVECLHDLLLMLRAATDSWELIMLSQVSGSPQRHRGSPSTATPVRPPSCSNFRSAPSSARLCRGRSASTAADNSWIDAFLSGGESRGRMELESEREALMERLEVSATVEREAIDKGFIWLDTTEDDGLRLRGDVVANAARRYVRAMTTFLEDEEELLRYQLEVLCEQDARRLRMLCNSRVCDVDLSKIGSFIRSPSFPRSSLMRSAQSRQ